MPTTRKPIVVKRNVSYGATTSPDTAPTNADTTIEVQITDWPSAVSSPQNVTFKCWEITVGSSGGWYPPSAVNAGSPETVFPDGSGGYTDAALISMNDTTASTVTFKLPSGGAGKMYYLAGYKLVVVGTTSYYFTSAEIIIGTA